MKVVLATPLYPPEIAEPAPYIKELARRLSSDHEVTLVAYSHLPEKVPDVRIVVVEKHRPLFLRLFSFFRALQRATRSADIIFAVNGPSVELPVGIIARMTRVPIIFAFADSEAHLRAEERALFGWSEQFIIQKAKEVVREFPPERPEILPLEAAPREALEVWETAWEEHVRTLNELFAYEH